jgi:hypothetical protein
MTADARIFLAHASEDKHLVRDIYSKLSVRGFKPWLDEKNLLPDRIGRRRSRKPSDKAAFFSHVYPGSR